MPVSRTFFFCAQKRVELFQLDSIPRLPGDRYILLTRAGYSQKTASWFDEIYHLEDAPSLDSLVEAEIKKGIKPENLYFLSTDEMLLLDIAALRTRWNISGPSESQIKKFRDKLLMKTMLQQAGIKVPGFTHLHAGSTYSSLSLALGTSFIIKPIMGASSLQTVIISSALQFERWHQENQTSLDEFEAEEYLQGDLFHCDCFVEKGSIVFSAAFKYLHPCLAYTEQKILASIPLEQDCPMSCELKQFNENVITSLEAHDGPYHLECFLAQGTWYFLEIAARPPGGLIVEATEKNFGVNVYRWAAEQMLSVKKTVTENCYYHSWAYIPRKQGTVKELLSPDLQSEWEIEWKIKPAEQLVNTADSVMAPPAAIIWLHNTDLAVLEEDLQKLSHSFPYVLE